MKRHKTVLIRIVILLTAAALLGGLMLVLWENVPDATVRCRALLLCVGIFLLAAFVCWYQKKQVSDFADDICETLDALIAGREPENYYPYEDTLNAKVQGKLLQYRDIMREGKIQSQRDRQTLQELVSDISHQVKTPIANLQMFADILHSHSLTPKKQAEFLETMSAQINKLEFLMQSLIKMSRLEAGTFALHIEDANLYDTIARAVSTVWAKADAKQIRLDIACDDPVMTKHDAKWTAEALGNILDNAVKYTPEGGSITLRVRPWHIFTRIDITDTGIGIPEEHYHDIFKRFYRAQEAAACEGVGLGLYLAQGIIAQQKGYISVRSPALRPGGTDVFESGSAVPGTVCAPSKTEAGPGSTFSVYLPR